MTKWVHFRNFTKFGARSLMAWHPFPKLCGQSEINALKMIKIMGGKIQIPATAMFV
jgi:hypothetical protein